MSSGSKEPSITCQSSSSSSSVKSNGKNLVRSLRSDNLVKRTAIPISKKNALSTRSRSTSSQSSNNKSDRKSPTSVDMAPTASQSAGSSPMKKIASSGKRNFPGTRKPLGEIDQTEKSNVFLKPIAPPPRSTCRTTSRSVKPDDVFQLAPNFIKKSASAQNVSKLNDKSSRNNSSSNNRRIQRSPTVDTVVPVGKRESSSENNPTNTGLNKSRSFTVPNPIVLPNAFTTRDDLNLPGSTTVGPASVGDIVTAIPAHHLESSIAVHNPVTIPLSVSANYSVNLDLVSRMEKEKKQYEQRVFELNSLLENKTKELDRSNQRYRALEKNRNYSQELCDRLAHYYDIMFHCMMSVGVPSSHQSTITTLPSVEDVKNELLQENQENLHQPTTPVASMKGEYKNPECEGEGEDAEATESVGMISFSGTTDTKDFVIKRWQQQFPPENVHDMEPHPLYSHAGRSLDLLPAATAVDDRSTEVSVADLQDKLLQLEENQYSTNEELQATLQELCDLQKENDELKFLHQETLNEQTVLYEAIQMQKDREKRLRQIMVIMQHLLTAPSSRKLITWENDGVTQLEESKKMNDLLNLCDSLEEDKQFYMRVKDDLATSYEDMLMENSNLRDRCETLGQQMVLEKQHYHELHTQHIAVTKKLDDISKEKASLEQQIECLQSMLKEEANKHADSSLKFGKEMDVVNAKYQSILLELNELQKKYELESERCHSMQLEKEKVQKLEEQWRETQGRQQNEVQSLREQCKSLECERHRFERLTSQLQQRIKVVEEKLENANKKEMELHQEMQLKIEKESKSTEEWKSYEKDLLKVICVAEDGRLEALQLAEQLKEKMKVMETQLTQVFSNSFDTTSVGVQASNNPVMLTGAASRLSTARIMATTQLGTPSVSCCDANAQPGSVRKKKSNFTTPDKSILMNASNSGLVKAKVATFEAAQQSVTPASVTLPTACLSPGSRPKSFTDHVLKADSAPLHHSFSEISQEPSEMSTKTRDLSTSLSKAENTGRQFNLLSKATTLSGGDSRSHSLTSSPNKETFSTNQSNNTYRSSVNAASSSAGMPSAGSSTDMSTNACQTFPRRTLMESVSSRNSIGDRDSKINSARVESTPELLTNSANQLSPKSTANVGNGILNTEEQRVTASISRHSSVKLNSDARATFHHPKDHTDVSAISSRSHSHICQHAGTVSSSSLSSSLVANHVDVAPTSQADIVSRKDRQVELSKRDKVSSFYKSVPTGALALQQSQTHLTTLRNKLGSSSMRNALLTWCQTKLASYSGVELTNFSSSWSDGLAVCGLMHSYLPHLVDYKQLLANTKSASNASSGSKSATSAARHKCFEAAIRAAESVGIDTMLTIDELLSVETPAWRSIMNLVTLIYMHFEVYMATENGDKTCN